MSDTPASTAQEAPTGPGATLPDRTRLVARAVDEWKRQLIDLGGRNNLLYFRDLRAGTLDLGAAPGASHLERLFEGRSIRLSELFPDPVQLKDASRRARALRERALENEEERGLLTLHVARGLATWQSDRSAATANAPVLLFPLVLRPIGVLAEDFELQAAVDVELNPTLVHLLSIDFAVKVNEEALLAGPDEETEAPTTTVFERLLDQCRGVSGFRVTDRIVAGNFSYAKLPMVQDLERSQAAIEAHDLLAAIAGDTGARHALHERNSAIEAGGIEPVPPPTKEYLVLDADSSQSAVVEAGLAGENLVVIGPPGTGKSQTISNVIATLVANGKSVLFVAEKRAAIEAVVKRLNQRGLRDLVLDLHGGVSNRQRIARELAAALSATHESLAPDVSRLNDRLERRRAQLERYADALHAPSKSWGITPFDVQSRLLAVAPAARTEARVRGASLEALSAEAIAAAADAIERFVELGGLLLLRGEGPWSTSYRAGRVVDGAAVETAQQHLHDLRLGLPRAQAASRQAAGEAGLREPVSLAEAEQLLTMLADVNAVSQALSPSVFAGDVDALARDLAPGGKTPPLRLLARLFNGGFRSARARVRALAQGGKLSDGQALRLATTAAGANAAWRAWGGEPGTPRPVASLASAQNAHAPLMAAFDGLSAAAAPGLDAAAPVAALATALDALDGDRATLLRLPELHRLEAGLRAQQLGDVLDEAVERNLSPREAAEAVEHAWLASILDRLNVERPDFSGFDERVQQTAVGEFAQSDREHIEVAAQRVRRAWAEGVVRARNQHTDEAGLVEHQANLKRRHMPLRDLFDRGEAVLTAVKPCWVMSPLVVAQVLPGRPCFDVVVFDEASQILPADAACSLLRGRQAIVAGDPHQLPPTTFFSAGTDDDGAADESAEDETGGMALTRDIESILDVMRSLLPGQRVLSWHYRSKDERLITFSNAQETLYDWTLTTFPGALADGDCLRFEPVPFRPGAGTVMASNPDEVSRVIELVLEHARNRPGESLGVIALGGPHADALQEALRMAAPEHPELAPLLDEAKEEALFIKNLERVQGDERDAIILSTGYSRNVDGRVRYNFGPVNQEGGHRRLNVAVTRARRRMTVVSSFSGSELDPDRLQSTGARMLRDYLLYAESGGGNLGLRARSKPALSAFEADVRERLGARGLGITPQFGLSGYWIDFVVNHPVRTGEPVLAVETDGPRYHSAPTVRDRDRLRPAHLERLGWGFVRIWSTDWFRNPEREVERVMEAFQRAVAASDSRAAAAAGAPSPAPAPASPAPAAPQPATVASSTLVAQPARSGSPGVRGGRPITEYSHLQLRRVVRWVKSDGRLYTDEQLLSEVMDALGFGRRGPRIVEAISQAIDAEQGAG